VIAGLRAVRASLIERRNRRALTSCGERCVVQGYVDRRAPGAVMSVGDGCLIEGLLVAERNESRLTIGNGVLVGSATIVDCALAITIEDDVLISYQCIVADADNHSIYPELRQGDLANWKNHRRHDWTHTEMAPVRICRGAWIGARAIVLKGVTIGAGAVVGMGSVVTADVPPRTVVAGNPARVIRELGPIPVAATRSPGQ
jgi:acetyltransferase-like isoleucine patch superfamily enzyme